MTTAKPKAQAPAPRKPSSTETAAAIQAAARARTTKDQDDFRQEAELVATALGWDGEPDWVLHKIQVSDARNYLTKVFHELHVHALNPTRPAPTAAQVCEHLGITDADRKSLVEGRLAQILAAERKVAG